jgi:hypothetical protein
MSEEELTASFAEDDESTAVLISVAEETAAEMVTIAFIAPVNNPECRLYIPWLYVSSP